MTASYIQITRFWILRQILIYMCIIVYWFKQFISKIIFALSQWNNLNNQWWILLNGMWMNGKTPSSSSSYCSVKIVFCARKYIHLIVNWNVKIFKTLYFIFKFCIFLHILYSYIWLYKLIISWCFLKNVVI